MLNLWVILIVSYKEILVCLVDSESEHQAEQYLKWQITAMESLEPSMIKIIIKEY
jgi:hypothetical protein